jgi:hypothetical protein
MARVTGANKVTKMCEKGIRRGESGHAVGWIRHDAQNRGDSAMNSGLLPFAAKNTLASGGDMQKEELMHKLAQIEEQAHYTLAEFPKTLTKERLRMIVALARYLRSELSNPLEGSDPPARDKDDRVAH